MYGIGYSEENRTVFQFYFLQGLTLKIKLPNAITDNDIYILNLNIIVKC